MQDNLLCVRRRAFVVTTVSRHNLPVYPNLARQQNPTAIDQLWVADITYIRPRTQLVYVAVVGRLLPSRDRMGRWAERWRLAWRSPSCAWLFRSDNPCRAGCTTPIAACSTPPKTLAKDENQVVVDKTS